MPLEHFAQPIKEENIENHERKLKSQMLGVQLEYIQRLASGTIPAISGAREERPFVELLKKCTLIDRYIQEELQQKANVDDNELLNALTAAVLDKIQEAHDTGDKDWVHVVEKIIDTETDAAAAEINKKHPEKVAAVTKENPKVGILNLGLVHNREYIKKFGLSPDDDYISIHLEAAFKQRAAGKIELTLSQSLEKLAELIVEKYPETRAILARSWIVDSQLAARIGFEHVRREKEIEDPGPFWGQFVEKDGQLNKARIAKFLETGIPEYKVAYGAINVVDFLKKYLPESKKGEIELKQIRPGYTAAYKADTQIVEDIKRDWEKLTPEEIEERMSKCTLIPLSEHRGTQFEIPSMASVLADYKRKGVTYEEMRNDPRVAVSVAGLQQWMKDYKYIPRKVTV